MQSKEYRRSGFAEVIAAVKSAVSLMNITSEIGFRQKRHVELPPIPFFRVDSRVDHVGCAGWKANAFRRNR